MSIWATFWLKLVIWFAVVVILAFCLESPSNEKIEEYASEYKKLVKDIRDLKMEFRSYVEEPYKESKE